MRGITRRTAMASALVLAAMGRTAMADIAKSHYGPPTPKPTNPLAARVYVHSVVTPDLDASIRFYRDGFGLVEGASGTIAPGLPEAIGAGLAGRRYVLMQPAVVEDPDRGVIRLIEAPAGAAANRPRPGAPITDSGLAVMELVNRDRDESYDAVQAAGGRIISRPQYYFFRGIKRLNGVGPEVILPDIDVYSYSAFGPAGEQIFNTYSPNLFPGAWPYAGLHSPFYNTVLISPTRDPVWDFYGKIMGLKPISDIYTAQKAVNILTGADPDVAFLYSALGEGVNFETWAYDKPGKGFWPTSLDRTGLAMITMVVDDPERVRGNAVAAGIPVIGDGMLPLPGHYRPGFYLRGAAGELIEVTGRN